MSSFSLTQETAANCVDGVEQIYVSPYAVLWLQVTLLNYYSIKTSYSGKNVIPFVEESGVKWGMEHFLMGGS